jgi:hypothetical protein
MHADEIGSFGSGRRILQNEIRYCIEKSVSLPNLAAEQRLISDVAVIMREKNKMQPRSG